MYAFQEFTYAYILYKYICRVKHNILSPLLSSSLLFFHFSTNRQNFYREAVHVSACSANFSTAHRPDSAAETRVNIKKPFDSADNKHHARILIFNIAPEFQMRHPPYISSLPLLSNIISHLSPLPRSLFSIQGYYIDIYTRYSITSSRGGNNNA